MKNILLIAGEASADLYGSFLISSLKEQSKEELYFSGLGGDKMQSAGMHILYDFTKEAGTGLDPLKRLTQFARIFRQIINYAKNNKPDVAVLIDLPDFNIRLAKHLKRLSIPVVYYISPQVWAWRKGRIKTIAKVVDKMLVIFDFEKPLYEKYNIPVTFVGHPLLDVIKDPGYKKIEARKNLGIPHDALAIGFLPGSRKSEFTRHFPIMLKAAELISRKNPSAIFVLACAPQITKELIDKCSNKTSIKFNSYFNQTYDVMRSSDLMLTASGTATVEAAIFSTPIIVIYKVSFITASILGPLIKTPYYAMVNIIAHKKIVPELMQSQATPENIAKEVMIFLEGDNLKNISSELLKVRGKLGFPGASQRTALEILKLINNRNYKP
jgi:lipid-A-disaccharide synthase